uniref:Glycosyltransferase n=1 Tax=Candidatus Kentrum sp. DK TaxID=2126562 RepID=A0A450SFK5_9GAMM|nr:MAG: hypothetical protein BECKDK2373B_GA0170837_10342 [Candidatus Kentron sp. DK]
MNKPCRILLFAKAPIPGKAKTRLIPALGARGAGALQAALLRHTLTTVAQTRLECELWCHPDSAHPVFSALAREFGVSLHVQTGNDLGRRMGYAAGADRHRPAILIGADCPSLTAWDLREAALALEADQDAVLGPALDGGYYLLGLRQTHPSLFEGISWGEHRVLAETRARLRILGWRWRELSARRDIDRPDDLPSLAAYPHLETLIRAFT